MVPYELLEHVVRIFERLGIPYLVTGSVAAMAYGPKSGLKVDVTIKKMEYCREGGSEKHLRDITGMLLTSAGEIDRGYIEQWAHKLQLTEIWRAILARLKT